MADPVHVHMVTLRVVGLIVGGVGVTCAVVSAIITHTFTMAKIRKDLVDHSGLEKTIKDCKKVCDLAISTLDNKHGLTMDGLKQEHSLCSGGVAKQYEEQNRLLEEHTRLLQKGDDEFTALRLNFGVLIDALDITDKKKKEARARMDNIRETVLNNRKP